VSTAAELLEQQHGAKLQGGPVSVHIAAGPFTFDTDLSFEPLQALLEVVEQERPDVLVLVSRTLCPPLCPVTCTAIYVSHRG
jgi:DNA polymerase alpha subunit B